jgi:hypothetical protein
MYPPQSGGHELSVQHFTPRLERLNQNLQAILNGSDVGLFAAIATEPEIWQCESADAISSHPCSTSFAHEDICPCLK